MVNINCPNCDTKVSRLYLNCPNCDISLSTYILMAERIAALEIAGLQFLEEKKYISAHRVYSILLEYKPESRKYLIDYAQSTIGLGDLTEAEDIAETLSKRFIKNKEVENLMELIKSKKA
jgi:hypothetical protein